MRTQKIAPRSNHVNRETGLCLIVFFLLSIGSILKVKDVTGTAGGFDFFFFVPIGVLYLLTSLIFVILIIVLNVNLHRFVSAVICALASALLALSFVFPSYVLESGTDIYFLGKFYDLHGPEWNPLLQIVATIIRHGWVAILFVLFSMLCTSAACGIVSRRSQVQNGRDLLR